MKRCNNCLMLDTKPGLILDKNGICQACLHAKEKKNIDYKARMKELNRLCGLYTRNPRYDCIIPVSGGKDSYYQVYLLKEIIGMNPLLVTVNDPYTKTKVGIHNLKNLRDVFNCDLITLDLSPDLVRRMTRVAFEEFGSPTWPIDRAIYCFPIRMAINMSIPLVFYGENVSWEYGGVQQEETCSAKDQINNDIAKDIDFELWYKNGITEKELNLLKYPSTWELEHYSLNPIYLSYFVNWNGYYNYEVASRFGFKTLAKEWNREGYIDNYDQIDSIGYLINVWMKYPKFGFARVTDVVGYWRRIDTITKENGKKLIELNDHKLDPLILKDFLDFTGYTENEFWGIVEKFWNRDIFEKKVNGKWERKQDECSNS